MNFRHSSERLAMADSVSRFALARCEAGVRRAAFEGDGHDADFWAGLADLGALGVMTPEAHGGLGLSMIDAAIVAEALGHAAAPGPFLGTTLTSLAISAAGSEEQKRRWLAPLASGAAIGAIAFCEEQDRNHPDEARAQWSSGVLSGRKLFAHDPQHADVLLVSCGDGLALVERSVGGVTMEPLATLDRTRPLAHIAFDEAPGELLPMGQRYAEQVFDAGLVLLAADAFGGARRCVEMSVSYGMLREQFGRKIGSFQGVKHQIADMAVDVEPARGLSWYAAYAYDRAPQERSRAASAAKAHVCDVFMRAARQMIEIHGGIGYTWGFDAHIWLKRAQFDFACLGTPSRHRDRQARAAGWADGQTRAS